MTLLENPTEPNSIAGYAETVETKQHDREGVLKPASRLRESIPQICVVSAKNLLLITLGTTTGFPTILLPALQKENPDIPVTLEDLTWIASITLAAGPLGCLASGPISEFMGRKRSMLISNIPYIIGWILIYYATTPMMLYIPMSLTGFTGGLIEGPILTYVSEVTQPHLRGLLSATASLAVILGVFMQFFIGSFVDWRQLALLNITFPVLCALALLTVPESPYWLAAKGRIGDAEKALRYLRGWVKASNVQEELRTIVATIDKSERKTSDEGEREKWWKAYFRKTVTMPFLLVTICFFADAFGGATCLQTYAVSIFENFHAPIDKYTATVCLGTVEMLGTVVCVVAIHFTGKRKLSFFSLIGTGISFTTCSLYSYLLSHETIDPEEWTWIPTMFLILAAFLSHCCIKLLAWILIGEVFPVQVRSGATGVAAAVGYIFFTVANKIYLYMINAMDYSGTFIFYASMNFLICAILYFILPETEGRTLQDIEDHYAGVTNLKDKPKKDALPFKEQWQAENPTVVSDEIVSRL